MKQTSLISPDHTVAIVVAVVAALGVVIAAWIGSSSSGGGQGGGGDDGTSLEAPVISMESVARRGVNPPLRVEYTFRGRAQGLGSDDYIFIVAQEGTSWVLSPPGRYAADGSWRVVWMLHELAEDVHFSVVVTKGQEVACPSGHQCATQEIRIPGAQSIKRLGPTSDAVIARDDAVLSSLVVD